MLREYRRSRARLLLWSSLCFIGLAVNNVLLLVDRFVYPSVDPSVVPNLVALAAVLVLLYGLAYEGEE